MSKKIIGQKSANLVFTPGKEVYVVEAVLAEENKPIDEQVLQWGTYAVCESWEIAREIERGDAINRAHGSTLGIVVRSRICGPFTMNERYV